MRTPTMNPFHPAPVIHRGLRLACSFFLAVFAAPAALAADPAAVTSEQFASIRHAVSELIRKEMKAKDVPGLSIALVEDQKIVWAEGFGYGDRARRRPAPG